MPLVKTGPLLDVKEELNVFGDPYFVVSDKSVKTIDYQVLRKNRAFGLWEVKPLTGPVPASLQGSYTNPLKAIKAIEAYFKTQPKKRNATNKVFNSED